MAQVWLSITEWKHGQLDFAAREGQFSGKATAIPGLSTTIIPKDPNLCCRFQLQLRLWPLHGPPVKPRMLSRVGMQTPELCCAHRTTTLRPPQSRCQRSFFLGICHRLCPQTSACTQSSWVLELGRTLWSAPAECHPIAISQKPYE